MDRCLRARKAREKAEKIQEHTTELEASAEASKPQKVVDKAATLENYETRLRTAFTPPKTCVRSWTGAT